MPTSLIPLAPAPGDPLGLTLDEAAIEAGTKPSIGVNGLAEQLVRGNSGFAVTPGTTNVLTYAFLSAPNLPDDARDKLTSSFLAFDAVQQAAFNQAIAVWEDFANVDFQQVTSADGLVPPGTAGVNLWIGGFTEGKSFAFASPPLGVAPEDFVSDLRFNLSDAAFSDASLAGFGHGGYGFTTFLHELGHVLGLQHPGSYDASDAEPPTFLDDAAFQEDNRATTLMSYFSELYGGAVFGGFNPTTPLAGDILALQQLYGTPAGGLKAVPVTTYGYLGDYAPLSIATADDAMVGAIHDANPVRLDLSPYHQPSRIDLEQIWQSTGGLIRNLQIVATTLFEVIGGHGDDTIEGDDANQTLQGGGGDDSLAGRGGMDRLLGGDGNDTLVGFGTDTAWGGAGDDLVRMAGTGGPAGEAEGGDDWDTLVLVGLEGASFTFTPAGSHGVLSWTGFEQVDAAMRADLLTGVSMTGGANDDTLTGAGGQDTLQGGQGMDVLRGLGGDDRFEVGFLDGADSMDGGEGVDTVVFTVSGPMGLNVNLSGPGFGPGGGLPPGDDAPGGGITLPAATLISIEKTLITLGDGADHVVGSFADDTILGAGGDDTLDGASGADLLEGGADNDLLSDSFAGGPDTMRGGEGHDTLISGSGADLTEGGAGNDLLRNRAFFYPGITAIAAEYDTMQGGDGDDTIQSLTPGSFDGGAGTDLLEFSLANAPAGVTLKLGNPSAETTLPFGTKITGFERYDLALTGFDDQVSVAYGQHALDGGYGADILIILLSGGQDVPDSVSLLDPFALPGEGTTVTFANGMVARGFDLILYTKPNTPAGSGDDLLFGTETANHLLGLGGNDTLRGFGGSDTLSGGSGADKLYGGKGDDVYYVETEGDQTFEQATEGVDRVYSTMSWTLAENFETLILLGQADLDGTGNGQTNRLDGTEGANLLDGAGGNDGLFGKGGADHLVGGDGNDSLDGGLGADVLEGGAGDDVYIVDEAGDTTLEQAGSGLDRVKASLDWTLAAELERLSLLGAADLNGTGNGLDNRLDGNAGANALAGGEGNDSFYGLDGADTLLGGSGNDAMDGGAGADSMAGGVGDDWYFVNDPGDLTVELAGQGQDRVSTVLDWVLGAEIERLSLQGAADLNGTGNALDNRLDGNAGANLLAGGEGHDTFYGQAGADTLLGGIGNDALDGGAGADSLVGGLGDDWYFVNDPGDLAIELAGQGYDRLSTSINWTLGAQIERLGLLGTADLDGTGNALDNRLDGNAGANRLEGGDGRDTLYGQVGNDTLIGGAGLDSLDGGAGDDRMEGGVENDIYIVDSAGDVVIELANGGAADSVRTSLLQYVIPDEVEYLTVIGSGAFEISGNAKYNMISGNSGNDTIDGLGGNDTLNGKGGVDRLGGQGGNDVFTFHRGESAGDIVTDFDGKGAALGDRLIFNGYGPGASFTDLGGGDWQLTSGDGLTVEVIHFLGTPTIHLSDYVFK